MFRWPATDEHVHCLLEEIHTLLSATRKHQLVLSNKQCDTMNKAIDILEKMLKRQGKILEEVLLGSKLRQVQYETTLNMIIEQQRQTLEFLQKHFF